MAHIRKRARPPDNWLSALLDYLLAWTLAGARWLARQAQPLLWSPTGYANPRVAHLRGALGYHLHSYEVALTSVERWQNGQDELFPAVLQVQTINRCNAACAMCPYPYTIHRQPRELMDDALFSKIVQECTVEPGLLDFVPMAKNEPLLDPRLDTRIQEFRAAALPHQMVELVTNGSTLSAERFRRLAASGVDLITISLNAASAETYRLVMGGLSWQRIMRNLEEISQVDRSQVNLYLRFVKQRDNQNDYRTFVRQWGRRGFNLMAYEVNNRAGAVRGYGGLALRKNRLVQRVRKAVGRRIFRGCPYAFSVMHILQNGDVPLCANDWENRLILGNVRQQSIRAIFNSVQVQAIRQLMVEGHYDQIEPCRTCSFRHEWL